ncbi:helix-turn-helix domain-containing protein [Ornithinibacillus scapharcae]|uniref:helix-turn-helix domain-containing protein n=1 Tax=Ornithinibacillus scapharcae TaxID=1147159 RepID=UPI000225B2E9|nr:helix-turn-helix transcriptional regulator [Ornithinibacillus scapharcae]
MKVRVEIHLQDLLTKNGMSQNELARRLELSPSTVNDMCKKPIKRINTETIAKIAEIFNIRDINDIISLEQVEYEEKSQS